MWRTGQSNESVAAERQRILEGLPKPDDSKLPKPDMSDRLIQHRINSDADMLAHHKLVEETPANEMEHATAERKHLPD